jgi:UDP-glucose 4-epimerase
MKVVVTGGAGFIGSNTCRALLQDPRVDEIIAIDDLSTGDRVNLEGIGVELVQGSVLDPATLDRAFVGTDVVVHLAARPSVPRSVADPLASHQANATGTVQVLEAARRAGKPRVLVASSSSVYGANSTLPKHEGLTPMPCSPYAASKLATEAYSLAYARTFDLEVLAFRFFNVFGPRQPAGHAYAAVIPAFVDAALAGRALVVYGDGKQTRDFTFVDTVTAVLCDAVTRHVTSDTPVNLAFGTRTDLLTVISMLESIMGRRLQVQHCASRAGDVRDSQADQTRLADLFPDLLPVDLEIGLRRTVEWFRSRHGGD